MVEKIGYISDSLPMSPDAHIVTRRREALDVQARFLEESGIADYLKLAVEVIPGASFYYSDSAAFRDDRLLPGYTLLGREQERPLIFGKVEGVETFEIAVLITPNVKSRNLDAMHIRSGVNFTPNDPNAQNSWCPCNEYFHAVHAGFSTSVGDKRQMVESFFGYVDKTGLVPPEDKAQVLASLAARR